MNINKSLPVVLKGFVLLVTFAVMIKPGLVLATENEHISVQQSSNINQWQSVSDSTLASLRGGFVLPNGIIVDISFGKQIFQNGIETLNSYFETPQNLALVTNGEFNISSELNEAMNMTVIQNDLDGQLLQTLNTINIDIKNLNNVNQTFSTNQFYNQFVLPNTPQ